MKRLFRLAALFVLSAAAGAGLLWAQTPARFFDTAAAPQGKRLTVFYPSVGTLKALLALKEQGLVPVSDLEIVGVRHLKEKTDYAEAEKFVREKKLDWIKFHTVTADLAPETIFKPNAASAELEKIFALSSGIIFFGGPDIVPALYGEKTGLLTVIDDPWRHFLELTAVFHLLGGSQDPVFKGYLEKRPDFAVLGICLGMQTLNVGAGGTLIQDIWTDIYHLKTFEDAVALGQPAWHTNPHRRIDVLDKNLFPYMLHPVRFAGASRIAAALGLQPADTPYVMSAHHQSAGRHRPRTAGRGRFARRKGGRGRGARKIWQRPRRAVPSRIPHALGDRGPLQDRARGPGALRLPDLLGGPPPELRVPPPAVGLVLRLASLTRGPAENMMGPEDSCHAQR